MKALSLWQPWATLWVMGIKPHETRAWGTRYRGPLAVHASKRPEWDEILGHLFDIDAMAEGDLVGRFGRFREGDFPRGCVVGVGVLNAVERTVDAVRGLSPLEEACGNYGPGRMAWSLGALRRLAAPVPCRGRQGLFDLPADVEAQVRAQLGEAT